MTTMKHGPYVATIEYDAEIGSFFGEVVNMGDTITFYGGSVEELQTEFARSIEAHLAFCARRGIDPGKPCSGRIPLRVSSELHRKLVANAAMVGKPRHPSGITRQEMSFTVRTLGSPRSWSPVTILGLFWRPFRTD